MKIALVAPGGVDRSGEYRAVPALLVLIGRLALRHHVFALAQEPIAGAWNFAGAHIHNIGARGALVRAISGILRENRAAPFDIVHSMWSG